MSLTIDDLMLVHVTNVRPTLQDGKLIMKTGGSKATLEYRDNKIFAGPRNFSRPHRMTLHWSLNGVTRTAGIKENKNSIHYGIPGRYAIIEPIRELKEELWGGGFDDLYSLGDHILSENSLLIVPEEEEEELDTEQLRTLTSLAFYEGYTEGFTNDHMRTIIADILESLKKPRMILNGLFLNEEILSTIFKITFPSRWKMLTIDELVNDDEFTTLNEEKMCNMVSGIINANGMRLFVCKGFADQKFPMDALLMGETHIIIREEELGKILTDANYVIPEFEVIHPNSHLYSYERKLVGPLTKEELCVSLDEVRKYIMEKKPTATSLDGLNRIMERIRNRS